MRLERLTANKIKIFLTSDDLFDRGLSKEDIWKDSIKWNQLFHDLVEEASEEFDVDIQGSVAVEVFSLQAQGMILIITVDEAIEDEEILYDGFIEMQVRMEGFEDLLYEFDDFEDIIGLSKRLSTVNIFGGSLYAMHNRYYLVMNNLETENNIKAACVLSEFGNASILSPYVLAEYGKRIIENNAVETILQYFK
ncbi:adapter protein MecA 1/2 [Neobacillus sp. B4I6]|jgi:adapter protein MecA 1/2|uniref:genetic competence negative regulator n=1 Tax=Bacillaceae TaxID=186817 RepID=UPI001BECA06A|nr:MULTISPECIES: genetic competence negative regulator [unclassified Bacillus (in: firmicutes)]MBT2698912.1 genetic competence negative regulator [Bacillus sp. ISL-40]MBT2721639.1 genetic competence negative regulator [Bacillus sp. ISL-46]MBT2726309.1 genetic competence negative regulator [Bacillus sp. ISL-75]MBT2733277.1 genetic competence negative regulator [Bacillus sp. ISL-7]MBT2744564.1 genetic competence negative regulator [Bacillus sp. ISL-77]